MTELASSRGASPLRCLRPLGGQTMFDVYVLSAVRLRLRMSISHDRTKGMLLANQCITYGFELLAQAGKRL